MTKTIYKSSLGQYMQCFLEQRRKLGYKALDIEYGLRTIDQYLQKANFKGQYITEQIYEDWWRSTSNQLANTRYGKASVFRRFLKYLAAMGIDCYIPRLPKKNSSGRIPYTFSEEEMAAIFTVADNLRMKERHSDSIMISIPALIRLLYSTAIRIGEALAIKIGNVDFDHHVIKLEYTKNGHQRYAPINDSMEKVLRQYISYRNRLPYAELQDPESHLFVSSQGNSMARKSVLEYMHRIISDAGIEYKGGEEGPHLHSLRHTSCVHSMVKLSRNGMDLYCYLPVLSVFMGHRKVIDTENYIHLTQEMYPELIKQDKTVSASINGIIKRANLMYNEDR